jgi:hypothetical protein
MILQNGCDVDNYEEKSKGKYLIITKYYYECFKKLKTLYKLGRIVIEAIKISYFCMLRTDK